MSSTPAPTRRGPAPRAVMGPDGTVWRSSLDAAKANRVSNTTIWVKARLQRSGWAFVDELPQATVDSSSQEG